MNWLPSKVEPAQNLMIDYFTVDRKGCDDDSCPLGLSDLNFRSLIDAKKESKPESRSSPSISRHSSATINRRHSPAAGKCLRVIQADHINLLLLFKNQNVTIFNTSVISNIKLIHFYNRACTEAHMCNYIKYSLHM